jgi:predicted helicase
MFNGPKTKNGPNPRSRAKGPIIREKFNTYHFANYKEEVIDLLMRLTTVSVKTLHIVEMMRSAAR